MTFFFLPPISSSEQALKRIKPANMDIIYKLYCFIVVFIYDCYYPIYSKGGTIISSEPKGTIIHERETGNFKLFIVAVTL